MKIQKINNQLEWKRVNITHVIIFNKKEHMHLISGQCKFQTLIRKYYVGTSGRHLIKKSTYLKVLQVKLKAPTKNYYK